MTDLDQFPLANIAVCGRFHFSSYVQDLHNLGGLNCYYHSSRISMTATKMGLPPRCSINIFPKQYLLRLHLLFLGNRLRIPAFPFYDDLWQIGVLMNWRPAPILHHMLHGNGRMLIRQGRRDGGVILGEPVNSHPDELRQLLNDEHERLGIDRKLENDALNRRLVEDAHSCDFLIVGSQLVKRSFVRNGFPAGKIHVLHYGTDIKRFSPLTEEERRLHVSGLKECPLRVICVGQISPRKGHVYLLEAWKRLNIPRAELLFIGPIDPAMKRILARYEGLFSHIPYVPHHLLKHYYGMSDIFVLPSLEDGWALVCAEALSCGLPIITTDNTGASEIVSEGGDGFIVPARSVTMLSERIECLYDDQQLRKKMSDAAIEKASTLLWSDYAKNLMNIYRSIKKNDLVKQVEN